MSVGRLLTLGLGTPFSDVGFIVTLGLVSGSVIPPTPDPVSTATPGRVLFSGLTGRTHDDEEKRRRNKQSVDSVDVSLDAPHETIDQKADYIRQSASLSKALSRLHAERDGLLANIQRLETIQTAKAEHELILQRQALILAAAKEAMILEQLEVIDVAYCAAVILILH